MLNVSAEFLAGRKEEKEEEEEEEKEVHERSAISELRKQFHVVYHVKAGWRVTLTAKPKQIFKASLDQTNQAVALTAALDVHHLWISLRDWQKGGNSKIRA